MPTKTPLQSITLTSNVTSVIFSNIDQRYKDLELVINSPGLGGGNNSNGTRFTINGDGSTNYSSVYFNSDSDATPASSRETSSSLGRIGFIGETLNTTSTLVANFQDYSNTTSYKSVISQSSTGSSNNDGNNFLGVSLWRSTAAINSISLVLSSGGNIAAGSTFDLYGISPASANNTQAFGGTEIYYDSSYVYHVFKSSGTFTPNRNLTADYLVIAGGGGGGTGDTGGRSGGGGGAGGLRSTVGATGGSGSLESALSLTANTTYTVTVGAGGSPSTSGSNSIFGSITSTGGGAGGVSSNAGATGGSGGGGSAGTSGQSGTAGTTGQGFAGGATFLSPQNNYVSAGGGGAGGAGVGGNTGGVTSTGGVGRQITAWSTATGTGVSGNGFYAGGGGGGTGQFAGATLSTNPGFGGGDGGYTNPSAVGATGAVMHTGGGGGGGNSNTDGRPFLGGNGGSGLVIVRYAR